MQRAVHCVWGGKQDTDHPLSRSYEPSNLPTPRCRGPRMNPCWRLVVPGAHFLCEKIPGLECCIRLRCAGTGTECGTPNQLVNPGANVNCWTNAHIVRTEGHLGGVCALSSSSLGEIRLLYCQVPASVPNVLLLTTERTLSRRTRPTAANCHSSAFHK